MKRNYQFEDLHVWQKSKKLTVLIYQSFPNKTEPTYRNQIRRAAISVMNNIAEGYERSECNQYHYFLSIAKGSCGEVRSMLSLADELKYTDPLKLREIRSLSSEISKMLQDLMKKAKA